MTFPRIFKKASVVLLAFVFLVSGCGTASADFISLVKGWCRHERPAAEYTERASSFMREGKYKKAVKEYEKALAIDPDDPKAVHGLKAARDKSEKRPVSGDDERYLDLERCLEKAEEAYMPLAVAKEQIELARIKVLEARRGFFPEATLSLSETKGIQSSGDKFEGREYGIEAKQPAWHSGELTYTFAQAKANLTIAESNYDKVRSEIRYEVKEAYYNLARHKLYAEFAQGLLEEAQPLFELARKEYAQGLIPKLEYLNSKFQYDQVYYAKTTADSDYSLGRLTLEQRLNLGDGGEGFDFVLDFGGEETSIDMTECVSLAIENRPDIKMCEFTVKSAEYGRKIADAKGLPQLDFIGHYKRSSEVAKDKEDFTQIDPHNKWYLGLAAKWPFWGNTLEYSLYKRSDPATISSFTGASEIKSSTFSVGILDNMEHFSEVQQSKIAFERAKDELNEIRKKTVTEVKEAYYEYEKARIKMESAVAQREFRERETEIIKVKSRMGEVELSEVLGTMTKRMEAEFAYLESQANMFVALAMLDKAIGIK